MSKLIVLNRKKSWQDLDREILYIELGNMTWVAVLPLRKKHSELHTKVKVKEVRRI